MTAIHFPTAHRHLSECASTNDLARVWAVDAANPAPHGALVSADWQTRGRGRRGRGWDASPGQSALMSFVLRPECPLSNAWQFAFVAALAVAEALSAYPGRPPGLNSGEPEKKGAAREEGAASSAPTLVPPELGARGPSGSNLNLEPRLKWPNDVLLNGSKAAGILVETVTPAPPELGAGGQSSQWVAVIGIGVNVNQTEFPDGDHYVYPPTSLRLETGQGQSVAALVQATAQGLERWNDALREQGWPAVREACQERLAVGALLRRGSVEAALISLNEDGSARVELPDGTFSDWASVEGEVGANSV